MNVKAFYKSILPHAVDIVEHLPTLTGLASNVQHVTEFGVRDGYSTLALMMGKPERLIGYDVQPCRNKPMLEQAAKELGVEWTLKIQDDCLEPIKETDLLLVDSVHEHNQLEKELYLHGNSVLKYIVMHDTHLPDKNNGNSIGMWVAILQFLAMNKEWSVLEDHLNCNGLTILLRE